MKKAISFRMFDANGVLMQEFISSKKYTVRGAMEWLESNGFTPMDDVFNRQANNKLKYIYEKWFADDSHTICHIL